MISRQNKNESKVAGSEDYDVNHPQNIAKPEFNSGTDEKNNAELPAIENLNHTDGLKDPIKGAKNDLNDPSAPKSDDPLHGDSAKTDLGNGSSKNDEEIIRT
jgi:hypothetical protein